VPEHNRAYSAFGVIHKSFFGGDSGTRSGYLPVTAATRDQRNTRMKDLKAGRKPLPTHGQRKLNSVAAMMPPSLAREDGFSRRSIHDSSMSEFKRGFGLRGGKLPSTVEMFDGRTSYVPSGLQAFNAGTRKRKPTIGANRSMVIDPFEVGVHESAHYATRSQIRRKRTRNPFRLTTIGLDPLKVAREEGRADAETARAMKRPTSPMGYESRFLRERKASPVAQEYLKMRQKLGGIDPAKLHGQGRTPFPHLSSAARVLRAVR